jgi:hypothetical protein
MFLAPFAVVGYRHWEKKRNERLAAENGGPEQPEVCEKDEAHNTDSTDADGEAPSTCTADSEAIKSDSSIKTQCTADTMSEDNNSSDESSAADETEFQKEKKPAHGGTEIDDAGSNDSQRGRVDETAATVGKLVLSRDTMEEHEDTDTPTVSPSTTPLASLTIPAKKVPGPFAGFRKFMADLQQPEQGSANRRFPAAIPTTTGKVEAPMAEATSQKFFYVDGRKIPMPKISYK